MNDTQFKQTFGLLLGQYRAELLKKTGDKKYTQKGLIAVKTDEYLEYLACEGKDKKKKKTICSNRTLVAMETGKFTDRIPDSTLHGVAINIGKKFSPSRAHRMYFEDLYERTMQDIEWMNIKNMKQSLEELHTYKDTFKDVLVLEELYEVFEALLEYYLERKIPSIQFMEKFISIHSFFIDEYKQIILHLCHMHTVNLGSSPKIEMSILEELILITKENFIQFISLTAYYFDKKQVHTLTEHLNNQQNKNLTNKNYHLQYITYEYEMRLMINTEIDKALTPMKKRTELMKKYSNYLSPHYLPNYYRYNGLYFYYQEDYLKSYQNYYQAVKLDSTFFPMLLLFLITSGERANISWNEIKNIMNDAEKNQNYFSGISQKMYMYFRNKYANEEITKDSAIFLEDMILNDMVPLFSPYTKPFKIFLDQLDDLSIISKRSSPYRLASKLYTKISK